MGDNFNKIPYGKHYERRDSKATSRRGCGKRTATLILLGLLSVAALGNAIGHSLF